MPKHCTEQIYISGYTKQQVVEVAFLERDESCNQTVECLTKHVFFVVACFTDA